MNYRTILSLVFLLAAAGMAAGERQIAFERDQGVWLANLDGTSERKIANGILPAIAPDGSRVAFVAVEPSGTAWIRRIALVEAAGGKISVLANLPSDSAYYPVWSPEGKRLALLLRQKESWILASVAPDGSDFRVVKKAVANGAFYSPSWARDQGSIFCHDITNIHQVSLDGQILNTWNIDRTIPNGSMSADG
ncbi:MAG: TolB family protein, partial [Chthoniobacterales bacterium]